MKLVLTKPIKSLSLPAWLHRLFTTQVGLVIVLLVAALLRINNLNWDGTTFALLHG